MRLRFFIPSILFETYFHACGGGLFCAEMLHSVKDGVNCLLQVCGERVYRPIALKYVPYSSLAASREALFSLKMSASLSFTVVHHPR
jgi:hypothetical protein